MVFGGCIMDEDKIFKLTLQSGRLMFKFNGIYAADIFPLHMPTKPFAIVNASPASSHGSHWIVLAKRCAYPIKHFADPLALAHNSYKHISDRFRQSFIDSFIMDLMEDRRDSNKTQQSADFQMYGLYCIYIAQCVLNDKFPFIPDINEIQLLSFIKHIKNNYTRFLFS